MDRNTLYKSQIDDFYADLVTRLQPIEEKSAAIVVSHMVPNALSFLPALDKLTPISALLPKPKSVGRSEHSILSEQFQVHPLTRDWAGDPSKVLALLQTLELRGKKVVIVDIGGYFAESVTEIAAKCDGQIVGVLEGTENGISKYEESDAIDGSPNAPPVITVARSPLKLPEDYLVASGVVFSIEAVLRQEIHEPIETRQATVIGYGRIGSSIAQILRGRGITTDIHDTDPIKLAEAAARGFIAHRNLSDAIVSKSLIICATGNKSLCSHDFRVLKSGCCVASVTSADDEFDLTNLESEFNKSELSDNLTVYTLNKHDSRKSFLLLGNGNAANFIHGAVIGPAMQLIEGEKMAAVKSLITGEFVRPHLSKPGIYELAPSDRRLVAETWNNHFL